MCMEAKQENPFSWQKRAKCIEMPSSIFFEDEIGNHNKTAYKPICAGCPVQAACLNTGLLYNFYGVWGGYTLRERNEKFPGLHEQLVEELEEIGEFVKLPAVAA